MVRETEKRLHTDYTGTYSAQGFTDGQGVEWVAGRDYLGRTVVLPVSLLEGVIEELNLLRGSKRHNVNGR